MVIFGMVVMGIVWVVVALMMVVVTMAMTVL